MQDRGELDDAADIVDGEDATDLSAGAEAARLGVDGVRGVADEVAELEQERRTSAGGGAEAAAADGDDEDAEEVASGPTNLAIQSIDTARALELYAVLLCKLTGSAPFVGYITAFQQTDATGVSAILRWDDGDEDSTVVLAGGAAIALELSLPSPSNIYSAVVSNPRQRLMRKLTEPAPLPVFCPPSIFSLCTIHSTLMHHAFVYASHAW